MNIGVGVYFGLQGFGSSNVRETEFFFKQASRIALFFLGLVGHQSTFFINLKKKYLHEQSALLLNSTALDIFYLQLVI